MRNIALFLTYEGTAYHGWQMQKNLATVQQTLEKAIAMIVGHDVHVTGCGRTDAGVHARCYVANFRTTSTIPVDRLPYALNTHLPVDIVVTKAFEVNIGGAYLVDKVKGGSLNEISYNLGRFMTINDFKQYVMSRSGFLKEKQLYFDLYEKKYVKQ